MIDLCPAPRPTANRRIRRFTKRTRAALGATDREARGWAAESVFTKRTHRAVSALSQCRLDWPCSRGANHGICCFTKRTHAAPGAPGQFRVERTQFGRDCSPAVIRLSTSLALGPPLRMKIWAARRSKWSGHTCAVRLRPYNIRFAKTVRTEPLGRDGLGKTLNHRQNHTGDPGAPSNIFEAKNNWPEPLAGTALFTTRQDSRRTGASAGMLRRATALPFNSRAYAGKAFKAKCR